MQHDEPLRIDSGQHPARRPSSVRQPVQASLLSGPLDRDELARRLTALLHSVNPKAEQQVRRAVATWKKPAHDALKAETGLRLKFEEHKAALPVLIDHGLPDALVSLFSRVADPAEWEIELRRDHLSTTFKTLNVLAANFDSLVPYRIRRQLSSTAIDAIDESRELLGRLLEDEGTSPTILAGILRETDDLFGLYYPGRCEIRLFWVAIAAVASMLKVSVESLTVAILVHEMAHAYTHAGVDADGNAWATEAFSETDVRIVEGIAEFYTEVVCTSRLNSRIRDLPAAYEGLLARSSGPYVVHRQWQQSLGSKLGEALRLAIILTRKSHNPSYENFVKFLQNASRVFSRVGTEPSNARGGPARA